MKYLRRNLSPEAVAGSAVEELESPGGDTNTSGPEVPEGQSTIETKDGEGGADLTKPNDTSQPDKPVEPTTPVVPPVTDNNDEPEITVLQEVREKLGYEIEVEDLTEDVDGIAILAQRTYEKGKEEGIKAEWEAVKAKTPAVVELAQWLASGRTEQEWALSKIENPTIDPEALDTADPSVSEKIVYNNFLKSGMDEEMAKAYTQMSIDSNRVIQDAKKIVTVNNQRDAAAKAEQEALQQAKRAEEQRLLQDSVNRQVAEIKKGKVDNFTIPQAEVDKFIEARFYDAGNPQYPGMTALDIKFQEFPEEKKNAIWYLIHKDIDLDKIVRQRTETVSLRDRLNKQKAGGTNMAGSTNRTAVIDDRSLDSPGA